jgi:hypothetical protein
MATPANNAAVLSNSLFLMEQSSCSRFWPRADPCVSVRGKTTPMQAQFRRGVGLRAAARRSVPMIRGEPTIHEVSLE